MFYIVLLKFLENQDREFQLGLVKLVTSPVGVHMPKLRATLEQAVKYVQS